MNQNYVYPNYQGNSMRGIPNRVTNIDQFYRNDMFSPNQGAMASFYLSFPDSVEWKDTIFKGNIQESNDDYTIIKDATTGKRIWFWNKYINYVIFEEMNN